MAAEVFDQSMPYTWLLQHVYKALSARLWRRAYIICALSMQIAAHVWQTLHKCVVRWDGLCKNVVHVIYASKLYVPTMFFRIYIVWFPTLIEHLKRLKRLLTPNVLQYVFKGIQKCHPNVLKYTHLIIIIIIIIILSAMLWYHRVWDSKRITNQLSFSAMACLHK